MKSIIVFIKSKHGESEMIAIHAKNKTEFYAQLHKECAKRREYQSYEIFSNSLIDFVSLQ